MDTNKQAIKIFNLAGALSEELSGYFDRNNIQVYTEQDKEEFTHILCSGDIDYNSLARSYSTIARDIKLISLSNVRHTQSFVLANGKLVFDQEWLSTPVGEFILDKFFLEFGGIEIKDSYPKFQELGKFNIINPFNSGEYADVMVYEAYQKNFSGLQIKTYFDHILMYLIDLKSKSKAGIPFEVSYGSYEGIFALQIHFVITDLVLSDISSCLSDVFSDTPLENVLNIALGSTSFFEFTYLNQVRKAVLTAFWVSPEHKINHRGLMFTDIDKSGAFLCLPVKESHSWVTKIPEITDITEKVRSFTDEQAALVKVRGKDLNQILAEKISGDIEMEKVKQILSGEVQEEEIAQMIRGLKEELSSPIVVRGKEGEDEKIRITSKGSFEDIVSMVKGKIDDGKDVFMVKSSGGHDIDSYLVKISGGLSQSLKGNEKLKNKLLAQKLPEKIKNSFFDFAKKINKKTDELNDEDFENFKENIIPEIIHEVIEYDESPALSFLTSSGQEVHDFFKDFKEGLREGIAQSFDKTDVIDAIGRVESAGDIQKVKKIVQDNLQNSLKQHFHLEEKNNLSPDEEIMIVKTLSTTLIEDESKFESIFAETHAEPEGLNTPIFKNTEVIEAKIKDKLKHLEAEYQKLQTQYEVVKTDLRSSKESFKKLEAISQAVYIDIGPQPDVMTVNNLEDLRMKEALLKKLEGKEPLNKDEVAKISALQAQELKLTMDLRELERQSKKFQIESAQKESLYIRELDKLQRAVNTKDYALSKAKEAIATIMDKKDHEISDLKNRLDQLSKAMFSDQGPSNAQQVKELERKNINLEKMLDVYKNKITSLAMNMNKQTGKEAEGRYAEENRKLLQVKTQLTSQIESMKRDLERVESKAEQDEALVAQLRKDIQRLHQDKSHTPGASEMPDVKVDYAAHLQLRNQFDAKVKEYEQRLKDSDAKILEVSKVLTKQLEEAKKKVPSLEQSIKQLNNDALVAKSQVNEIKREANKLRAEKNTLQNNVDRLQKELDKLKNQPKKAG